MMNNEGDGDLQLVFQFSVDLAWGHIDMEYLSETLADEDTILWTFNNNRPQWEQVVDLCLAGL